MNDQAMTDLARKPLPKVGQMRPRVLIAGGGVAALETLLAVRRLAEERVSIELLSPEREFTYRALAVAEAFGKGETHRFDLRRIAGDQGARHRADALAAVHPDHHQVETASGKVVDYDALVVAVGARPRVAVAGAATFAGPADEGIVREVLEGARSGAVRSIAFAAPGGVAWVLPLYELALMTAEYLEQAAVGGVTLFLVTPEDAALQLFETTASDAVATMLAERGIQLITHRFPVRFESGELMLAPADTLPADRVIALPTFEGPAVPALPADAQGFVKTGPDGSVEGVEDVYAAGDITAFPVKQGGIAAQQADAVAQVIAARAGADVTPKPFRPVLRGLLLTGRRPSYLRAEISGGRGESVAADHAIWWPPSKIAGRHLAPYLAARPGLALEAPPESESISIELDLE